MLKILQSRAQLWLTAVRDSFIVALPLTMMFVGVTVVLNFPSETYMQAMASMFGPDWKDFGSRLLQGTSGIMAVVIAVMTALRLESQSSRRTGGQFIAMITLAAFAGTVAPVASNFLDLFGFANVLLGAFVGVATVEVFWIFNDLMLRMRSKDTVRASLLLQDAVRLVWPGVLTVVTVVLLGTLARQVGAAAVHGLGLWMQSTMDSQLDTHLLSYISLLMSQSFWLMGVHGDNVVTALFPHLMVSETYTPGPGKVSAAMLATFVHLGGSGATAGVVLALLLHRRHSSMRPLALAALLPTVINVNELLIYGLPIVFSRMLLLPFIAAPLLCYSIAWLAESIGFLTYSGTYVIWSTPIFLSGYLVSGSWHGAAVQLAGLAASTAVYWPFLNALERRRVQRQRDELHATIDLVCNTGVSTEQFTQRRDNVGDMCRKLVADFERDLDSKRVSMFFQGKHDAAGRLCGAEALLRWSHAVYGPIPAFAIVRLAEESNTIGKLGDAALLKTCEAMAQWHKAGKLGVKVSVNVSPVQLESEDFVDRLFSTLQRCGVDASQLDIEITEGREISSSQQTDANLQALVDRGISLSLDDFGMGCTSLLYLQRFTVSCIKLDGILTRNALHNPVTADIIKTVCDLGRQRHTGVVAEFVETAAQCHYLAELGCSEFQGYLFSKPMSAVDFCDTLLPIEPKPAAV